MAGRATSCRTSCLPGHQVTHVERALIIQPASKFTWRSSRSVPASTSWGPCPPRGRWGVSPLTPFLPQSLFSGQGSKGPQQVVGSWKENLSLEPFSASEIEPTAKGGRGARDVSVGWLSSKVMGSPPPGQGMQIPGLLPDPLALVPWSLLFLFSEVKSPTS